MITVGMNYRVLPGKEAIFENAVKGVIKVMSEGTGHVHTDLFRQVEDAGHYLIISEWNDQTAYEAFIRSEQFAKVTSWGAEQILAGRPKHQVYQS